MKIALLASIRNQWESAGQLLHEIESSLDKFRDHELSVWLIDDGSIERPTNWNALATGGRIPCHVLELQGSHGYQRALSTGLGFLVCEMEANFDAFVLLAQPYKAQVAEIAWLIDSSNEHRGAVITSEGPSRMSWSAWMFRACTGKSICCGSAHFIPVSIAETLCHSSHSGSHLIASVLRLGVPVVTAPPLIGKTTKSAPSVSLSERLGQNLAALSVFREVAFARATVFLFGVCALLMALVLLGLAVKMMGAVPIPAWLIAVPILAFFFCLPMAVAVLVLTLQSFSLREMRTWTPALNSSALIRSVHKVKRGPYDPQWQQKARPSQ